jgi:hypothetical protein
MSNPIDSQRGRAWPCSIVRQPEDRGRGAGCVCVLTRAPPHQVIPRGARLFGMLLESPALRAQAAPAPGAVPGVELATHAHIRPAEPYLSE